MSVGNTNLREVQVEQDPMLGKALYFEATIDDLPFTG